MNSINFFPVHNQFIELCSTLFIIMLIFLSMILAYRITYIVADRIMLLFMNLQDKQKTKSIKKLSSDFIKEESLILTKIFKDK